MEINIQETWLAAGGNPGVQATKEELLAALRAMNEAEDEADAFLAAVQGAIGAQGLRLSNDSLVECIAKIAASNDESQNIVGAARKLVRCKGRFHSEQNYRALAALFGVTVPISDPWTQVCDGRPPIIEGSVGDAVQYLLEWDDGKIDAGWWCWGGNFQRADGTSEGMIDWDGKSHYVVAWMELPRREVSDETRAV